MSRHINGKSTAVGAVLGVLLLLAAGMAGAAGGAGNAPVIGRFQIACTDTLCYLVDTVTGQVWSSRDPDFSEPKLQGPAAAVTAEAKTFLGSWVSDDPNEDDLGLRVEPEGRAIATEGSKRYEGRWRVEGTRLILTVEGENLAGEMGADGRLSIWERGNEGKRITFKRVPEKPQAPQATSALEVKTLLGPWVSDDPNEKEVGLRLEPEGRAVATEGSKRYDGRWRMEGSRIIMNVDNDTFTGGLQPDGRLVFKEEGPGDNRIILKRVP